MYLHNGRGVILYTLQTKLTNNIHNGTGVIILPSYGSSFIMSTGHSSFCPADIIHIHTKNIDNLCGNTLSGVRYYASTIVCQQYGQTTSVIHIRNGLCFLIVELQMRSFLLSGGQFLRTKPQKDKNRNNKKTKLYKL